MDRADSPFVHETNIQADHEDYERWLIEYGLTHDFVRSLVDDTADHIEIPAAFDSIEVAPSPVEGLGVFAVMAIPAGTVVAPARLQGKRTHVGRRTNHSMRPNTKFLRLGAAPEADMIMVATRTISAGEELFMDYRQAGRVNGWGRCPDKSLSVETFLHRSLCLGSDTEVSTSSFKQYAHGVLAGLSYIPANLLEVVPVRRVVAMAMTVGYFRAGLYVGHDIDARDSGESTIYAGLANSLRREYE